MSIAQEQAVAGAIKALMALATDVRRPRPADWTPEEADERIARRVEQIARKLQHGTRA